MDRCRRRRVISEINVVPYIDVMLVLLVIFMVTAPLLMEGVKIELPEVDARPVTEDSSEPFVVHVDSKGAYYLNADQKAVVEVKEIRIKAAAVLRNNPKTQFLVRGDRRVDYASVMRAIVLLQEAGVSGVGLVTDTPGS